ncbi:MAG: cytochrome-c peroxidase [Bacteroidia bacterium]|nr:cytochrome-c peroxidase [Bacteroidia bacterium]MCZ2277736.1 cytochrome-c peroxidase [Bacteroidia bacterium]
MVKKIIFLTAAVSLLIVTSCKKEKDDTNFNGAPYNPTPYSITIPAHFPQPIIPASNATTVEGVKLGRMLYYDPLLHPTNSMSCSSCHFQEFGFCTPTNEVMPHVNLIYSNNFLWNGMISGTLEDAMRFEVNDFFQADMSKFQNHPDYPRLFFEAFGSSTPTAENAAKALAQFFRTMISSDSKFDKFLRHQTVLTMEEAIGFNMFFTEKADCFHCHSIPLTSDYQLHNIGLDSVFNGVNVGHYANSGNPADLGKFRTPSLKNVALQSAFMHDNRFSTLEEVVEFYNSGVKHSPSLDPIMTKPGKENGLGLTAYDKYCLVQFLNTMTDTVFLNNPALSSPF